MQLSNLLSSSLCSGSLLLENARANLVDRSDLLLIKAGGKREFELNLKRLKEGIEEGK